MTAASTSAFEALRKKYEERKQMMTLRSTNVFWRQINDKDSAIVRLAAPYQGFDRLVENIQKEMKLKAHYRFWILGDYNFGTKKPISNPPLNLTADDIRNLKLEASKIWTTPANAVKGIQEQFEKKKSYLYIRRNGVARDTSTSYTVLNAQQVEDEEWEFLLPNTSKAELKKLQEEETWTDISDEELHRLETLGVKENGQ